MRGRFARAAAELIEATQPAPFDKRSTGPSASSVEPLAEGSGCIVPLKRKSALGRLSSSPPFGVKSWRGTASTISCEQEIKFSARGRQHPRWPNSISAAATCPTCGMTHLHCVYLRAAPPFCFCPPPGGVHPSGIRPSSLKKKCSICCRRKSCAFGSPRLRP